MLPSLKMAQSQTPISPKLEQGRYIARDLRWGMSLDLSGADNRSLIAYGFHGRENQQWEFHPCGAGFVIGSVVGRDSFLAVRDLKGLHLEQAAEVVLETFPTCWELEVMDNGIGKRAAEDGAEDDENGDVYVRIRLPHSDMALSFKGSYAGAPLFLTKERSGVSTYWRLSPVPPAQQQQQVVKNTPISTTESVQEGAVRTTMITTTSVTTTTRTVTRVVAGDA